MLPLHIALLTHILATNVTDSPLPSPESPSSPPPHRRRPRYSGKNPRRFEEKYKEHDPQRYGATVAKVLASGKTPAGTHRPIMVAELLEVLAPKPGEVAVDCTLGYGGHARELLAQLQPGGHLLGLDADPMELPKTEARLRESGFGPDVFSVVRSNFAGLQQALAALGARLSEPQQRGASDGLEQTGTAAAFVAAAPGTAALWVGADCILADLGVSSMQLDDPARGFSTKGNGPLDMRMNPQRGQSAATLLAKTSPAALAELLLENADEPRATELAAALAGRTYARTRELVEAIRAALPKLHKDDSDLTVRRVFQALRIAVNDEFGALDTLLRHLPVCLNPGGRVAILTFHSGEDRRVKKAFVAGLREGVYADIAHEVIRPAEAERRDNSRSSAAKLRWARRAG